MAQYGSKKTCIAFGHIAKTLKVFSSVVSKHNPTYLISKNVVKVDAHKITGNGLAAVARLLP